MAATTPTSTTFAPTSGRTLVVATAAFMPPRLLPAGARLPRGVHAVLAFPAAPGSGRRGAMRLVVAASAGSDGSGHDYEETQVALDRGKKMVVQSWDEFEGSRGRKDFIDREPYELVSFEEDTVTKFEVSAWRGAKLATNALLELGPEGFSDMNISRESDLNNLKLAGIGFRRVAREAQQGYVRASSVREAADKLVRLYVATLSRSDYPLLPPSPTLLNAAPYPMVDPPAYFKDLAESFGKMVEAAAFAFY